MLLLGIDHSCVLIDSLTMDIHLPRRSFLTVLTSATIGIRSTITSVEADDATGTDDTPMTHKLSHVLDFTQIGNLIMSLASNITATSIMGVKVW
jgi:hypothetical protein